MHRRLKAQLGWAVTLGCLVSCGPKEIDDRCLSEAIDQTENQPPGYVCEVTSETGIGCSLGCFESNGCFLRCAPLQRCRCGVETATPNEFVCVECTCYGVRCPIGGFIDADTCRCMTRGTLRRPREGDE